MQQLRKESGSLKLFILRLVSTQEVPVANVAQMSFARAVVTVTEARDPLQSSAAY